MKNKITWEDLKNRHTNIRCEYLLLDTTIIKEF